MNAAIYLVPVLLCAVTPFFQELSENRKWGIFLGVFLCLFYCFGYMTGSDWRVYEDWYYSLDFNRFYYGYYAEPGYYLYMMLFRFLGFEFWPFFIMTKVFIFIVIYRTIFDFCKETGYLTLMYFLPWFGMYLLIDNPMRNCISVAIFLLSVKYIMNHQFWKFLLMMLLAASFHFSAILMILVYPLLNRHIPNWIYVILFLLVNFVFANREVVINVLTAVLGNVPYVQDKILGYLLLDSEFAQGKLFSFGMLWHFGLFTLLLCYRERITSYIDGAKGQLVFNAAILYMLFLRFAMTIEVFVRIQLYFSVFLSIAVGLALVSFKYRSRIMAFGLILLVSCYVCLDKATGTFRYVPYTNIVEYTIKGDFPSYSERYYYNYRYSPYRTAESH